MASTLEEYSGLRMDNSFVIAIGAFIFWEHILTLDDEVELFWATNLTGAAVLFLSNRYIVLLMGVYVLCGFVTMSDQSCALYAKAYYGITVLQYIPWAVFSALRAFALTRNITIGALVFILSIVTVGLNFSQYGFGVTGVNHPILGCVGQDPLDATLSERFAIVSRSCLIAADALLIYITWVTLARKGGTTSMRARSFVGVLLRDGAICFGILLVLNFLHLLLALVPLDIVQGNSSYVSVFTAPITAILVSRFLLDLQRANQRASNLTSHEQDTDDMVREAQTESLVFQRVVGSLASSTAQTRDRVGDMDSILIVEDRTEGEDAALGTPEA